jgi:decaprenylphospho-beta-D-ribofuranose 2-oxidase
MSERSEAGQTLLSGWGRTAATAAAEVVTPHDLDELAKSPLHGGIGKRGLITRGLGRSYGDAAQNAGGVVIDASEVDGPWTPPAPGSDGAVRLPAGLSIDALLRACVPRGWFVPVTPGTRFVTIGGAIASDIHGKNHHAAGSFMQHVRSLRMALPSGEVVEIGPGPDQRPSLFWATAGGMGLTGVIVDADVVLKPIESSFLAVDTDRAPDLDAVMALMDAGDDRYAYSVAWIDLVATGRSLGRSVLGRGDFAPIDALPKKLRSDPLRYDPSLHIPAPPAPTGRLNRLSIRAFNELWFRKSPRQRRGELQSIPQFFHPLDMVVGWNKLYGPRGFLQWQPVVPLESADVMRRIVERLATSGCSSFLAVLKRFGAGNPGPLSFPAPGWTISLDIPASAKGLAPMLDEMDRWVAEAGGRVYLAKDSRLRPELLPVMYPELDRWRTIRSAVDPDRTLQSDLARRLRLLD